MLGTLALAVIVEERTGRRFHQYVQENIFDPLGMDRARVGPEGVEGAIEDLGRLAAALAGDPVAPGVILSDEATRIMFADQLRFDGLPWPQGIEWRRDQWRGEFCVVRRGNAGGRGLYLRICPGAEAWVATLGKRPGRTLGRWSDDVLESELTKAP